MRVSALALLAVLAPSIATADVQPADTRWFEPARATSVIAGCLAHGSPAPSSKTCTDRYNVACQKANGYTTLAMEQCTSAAVDYWMKVVTTRTNALLARHDTALATYVRQSDAEWKRYRTSRCKIYATFQGTMWGPVGSGCFLDVTIDRAGDLAIIAQNWVSG